MAINWNLNSEDSEDSETISKELWEKLFTQQFKDAEEQYLKNFINHTTGICETNDLFSYYPKETDEELVIRLLKGDFENKCGISFDKFTEIHESILKNNPEKLI